MPVRNVSPELRPGEIALVGENGAGKLTGQNHHGLISPMRAAECANSSHRPSGHRPCPGNGHQQPALFPDLRPRTWLWRRAWRRLEARCGEKAAPAPVVLLRRVSSTTIQAMIVGDLTMPEQQLVEIARSLGADARILIADEPTASLARSKCRAFRVSRGLRQSVSALLTFRMPGRAV